MGLYRYHQGDRFIKHFYIMADNDKTLLADGFEDAFIGYTDQCGFTMRAIYDRDKCIEILVKRDEMTQEEAEEFFQFNTEGAYMGKGTPGFLNKCSLEEFNELCSQ